jgi:hypothetical protein
LDNDLESIVTPTSSVMHHVGKDFVGLIFRLKDYTLLGECPCVATA